MTVLEDLKEFQERFHVLEHASNQYEKWEEESKAYNEMTEETHYRVSDDPSILEARAIEERFCEAQAEAQAGIDAAKAALSQNVADREKYEQQSFNERQKRAQNTSDRMAALKEEEIQARSLVDEHAAREEKAKDSGYVPLAIGIVMGVAAIGLFASMAMGSELAMSFLSGIIALVALGVVVFAFVEGGAKGGAIALVIVILLYAFLGPVIQSNPMVFGIMLVLLAAAILGYGVHANRKGRSERIDAAASAREAEETRASEKRVLQEQALAQKDEADRAQEARDVEYLSRNAEQHDALVRKEQLATQLATRVEESAADVEAVVAGAHALSAYSLDMKRADADRNLVKWINEYSAAYQSLEEYSEQSPNVPRSVDDWGRIDQIVHMVESRRAADLSSALNLTDTKEYREEALRRMEGISAQLADLHSDVNKAHIALLAQNERAIEVSGEQLKAQLAQISEMKGANEALEKIGAESVKINANVGEAAEVAYYQRAALIGAAGVISDSLDEVRREIVEANTNVRAISNDFHEYADIHR